MQPYMYLHVLLYPANLPMHVHAHTHLLTIQSHTVLVLVLRENDTEVHMYMLWSPPTLPNHFNPLCPKVISIIFI